VTASVVGADISVAMKSFVNCSDGNFKKCEENKGGGAIKKSMSRPHTGYEGTQTFYT
jgi:hypothetical protein